jgi:hypothetical protein
MDKLSMRELQRWRRNQAGKEYSQCRIHQCRYHFHRNQPYTDRKMKTQLARWCIRMGKLSMKELQRWRRSQAGKEYSQCRVHQCRSQFQHIQPHTYCRMSIQ